MAKQNIYIFWMCENGVSKVHQLQELWKMGYLFPFQGKRKRKYLCWLTLQIWHGNKWSGDTSLFLHNSYFNLFKWISPTKNQLPSLPGRALQVLAFVVKIASSLRGGDTILSLQNTNMAWESVVTNVKMLWKCSEHIVVKCLLKSAVN